MYRKQQLAFLLLALVALINFAACAKTESQPAAQSSPAPAASASPVPKQITPAELAKLRWIEGTWRGTGGDVPPFFERYKFENDTTLLVETLADETLSKVSDQSRFELKDGHFGYSADGSGSVASSLDDTSITFEPTGKSHNSFRWQRKSANSWKAILKWTDKNGAPKERIYSMERLRQ
jgi:hypothetical protein